MKSNSLNLTFFLIKYTFRTTFFFGINLRFTATSQNTSAVLLSYINLSWFLFFIWWTFTPQTIFFRKVNIINIWFAPYYKLIWRNIEIFLCWSMYRGNPPLQVSIRSYNCTSLILIISLRERLILFAWFLLRPFQRLYLFEFAFWNRILCLLLIII